MPKDIKKDLHLIYKELFTKFGPQYWWPGKTRFEIIVGAILTQNTNWSNVEKAIKNLRRAEVLSPSAFKDISEGRLSSLIRPAGYYNVKARRLKNFINFFYAEYKASFRRISREPLAQLRKKLLSVNGIGPETADSILLYALNKPVFVVDAYTKRILLRHKIIRQKDDYHTVQNIFMNTLRHDTALFNEYHALIVQLSKEICRARPLCKICPLKDMPYKI